MAKTLVVAYEPVWAIGTGKTATPEIADEAHKIIRAQTAKSLSAELAASTRILYGGSVKPDKTAVLCALEYIDGALVGGAAPRKRLCSRRSWRTRLEIADIQTIYWARLT